MWSLWFCQDFRYEILATMLSCLLKNNFHDTNQHCWHLTMGLMKKENEGLQSISGIKNWIFLCSLVDILVAEKQFQAVFPNKYRCQNRMEASGGLKPDSLSCQPVSLSLTGLYKKSINHLHWFIDCIWWDIMTFLCLNPRCLFCSLL